MTGEAECAALLKEIKHQQTVRLYLYYLAIEYRFVWCLLCGISSSALAECHLGAAALSWPNPTDPSDDARLDEEHGGALGI